MSRYKEPANPAKLLDQLLPGTDAAIALDQSGLLESLKKALAERALRAEKDHHLDGKENLVTGRDSYSHKTAVTNTGNIDIDIPRDRRG